MLKQGVVEGANGKCSALTFTVELRPQGSDDDDDDARYTGFMVPTDQVHQYVTSFSRLSFYIYYVLSRVLRPIHV